MVDSSFAASPRWKGLQDLQQQRRESEAAEIRQSLAQQRIRASFVAHETDFLMSSIVPTVDSSIPPLLMGNNNDDSHSSSFQGSGSAVAIAARQSSLKASSRSSIMLDVSARRGASSIVDVRDEIDKSQPYGWWIFEPYPGRLSTNPSEP
jgi:hypothetical protein